MIEFRFAGLRREWEGRDDLAAVLVGVTAELEIVGDGVVIYREPDFPMAELATELARWVRDGLPAGADFELDSMSTPERGWVWVRSAAGGWRVGSIHQDRADLVVRSDDEIRLAVADLIFRARERVADDLGMDVGQYMGGADA